jgi:hypothetical protein
MITESDDILGADLVVADLTGLNANTFHELGIRHAAIKPTIHIARSATLLPFDNVSHRAILVDPSDWSSIEEARLRLAASARAIKTSDYRVSNPITQANAASECGPARTRMRGLSLIYGKGLHLWNLNG